MGSSATAISVGESWEVGGVGHHLNAIFSEGTTDPCVAAEQEVDCRVEILEESIINGTIG